MSEQDGTLIKAGNYQKHDEKDLQAITASKGYLAYIQLMTKASKVVDAGDFPVNNFALVQNQSHLDLGEEVDVVPICWRARAVEIGEDEVVSVFDKSDPEFQRIQEIAERPGLNGCMCGPEYLLWIPKIKQFATFLMGSKSAKREAPNMSERLGKGATLKRKRIETKKYTWWAPVVAPCTADLELPDQAELDERADKFNNPPKDDREVVKDEESEAQAR